MDRFQIAALAAASGATAVAIFEIYFCRAQREAAQARIDAAHARQAAADAEYDAVAARRHLNH